MGNCVEYYFCCDLNRQWFMEHLTATDNALQQLELQQKAVADKLQMDTHHALEHVAELEHVIAGMNTKREQLEVELREQRARIEAEQQEQLEHFQKELQDARTRCEEAFQMQSKQLEAQAQIQEIEAKLIAQVETQKQQIECHKDQLEQHEQGLEAQRVAIHLNEERLAHRFGKLCECLTKRLDEQREKSEAIRVSRSQTMPSGHNPPRALKMSLRQRWLADASARRDINRDATAHTRDPSERVDSSKCNETYAENVVGSGGGGGAAAESSVIVRAAADGESREERDELWEQMVARLGEAMADRLDAQVKLQRELEIKILEIRNKVSNLQSKIEIQTVLQSVSYQFN